jgi:flagellar motility protein MotE (MotC chaperone)
MKGGRAMRTLVMQAVLWALWAPAVALALSGKAAQDAPLPAADAKQKEAELAGPAQGPAIGVPQEILEMLDRRKQALDKREEAIRVSETRLASLKGEIEEILVRHEQSVKLAEKARKNAEEQKAAGAQKQAKVDDETRKADQARLAKMYETMPAEEAAARIEKMPNARALELLRLLKGKTAGAILAQIPPVKAAKLTEQLIPKQQ